MPTLADKISSEKMRKLPFQAAEAVAQSMQSTVYTGAKCRAIRALMAYDALSAQQATALVTTSKEEAQALLAKLAQTENETGETKWQKKN